MNICLLVTQSEWGGAQRYVFDLAAAIAGEHVFTIAAGPDGANDELFRRAQAAGFLTKRINHLRRAISPLHDIAALFEIAHVVESGRYDILHTNSSKADVLGALAARLVRPRPKVVATIHGWVFLEPLGAVRRAMYIIVLRLAARLRDATILLGKREQCAAIHYRIGAPERLTIIPLGIEPVTPLPREEARNRLEVPGGAPVVGAIANLYRTKGLDVLIAAAPSVLSRVPNARFVIIGEGPERAALTAAIAAAGLADRVHLLGTVPDAARCLSAFDVLALPSRKEGLPYALLEGVAHGLPIVATAVGDIPDAAQHKKNIVLIPSEDAHALADALTAALCAMSARKPEPAHTAAHMALQTKACYRKLIATFLP